MNLIKKFLDWLEDNEHKDIGKDTEDNGTSDDIDVSNWYYDCLFDSNF